MPSIRTALVLGLLSAVSPFAIDMYLPAMPAIEADLGAGVSGTQATIGVKARFGRAMRRRICCRI